MKNERGRSSTMRAGTPAGNPNMPLRLRRFFFSTGAGPFSPVVVAVRLVRCIHHREGDSVLGRWGLLCSGERSQRLARTGKVAVRPANGAATVS